MMSKRLMRRTLLVPCTAFALMTTTTTMTTVVTGQENLEWPTYGADLQSTRYAPLDQINADNFDDLEVVWRFKTDNFGPRPEFNFQATPLMVDGVLYSTAGTRRAVIALDAGTGELAGINCPAHDRH